MWYLLSIIISIIGSFITMVGEPMGAILFVPMVATGIWYDLIKRE